jgi:hypothetical protein
VQQTPAPRIARPDFRAALLTFALAADAAAAWAADNTAGAAKPLPVAIVDTLHTLSGDPHAGYRAHHAKGVLVSNATGVPTLPDADGNASPHGMAIRLQLPGGANTDSVAIQIKAQKAPLTQPLLLQGGIEPSADPVLLARPFAYATSDGQRAQSAGVNDT